MTRDTQKRSENDNKGIDLIRFAASMSQVVRFASHENIRSIMVHICTRVYLTDLTRRQMPRQNLTNYDGELDHIMVIKYRSMGASRNNIKKVQIL